MEAITRDSSRMIRSMVLGRLYTRMEACIKECGRLVKKMELVIKQWLTRTSSRRDNGKMEYS